MADIEFYVESSLGRELLATDGSGPYGLTDKTVGFGIPPIVHRFVEGAGEGGQRRNTRVAMRPLDLGMIFIGQDRLDLDQKVRDFANLISPVDPAPKLIAEYAGGEKFELQFVYESGLEISHREVQGNTFQTTLGLMCERPFWESQDPAGWEFKTGTSKGMLPKLGYLRLMDNSIGSTIAINNDGDVSAWPIWTFVGPMDSVTISSALGSFVYNAAIAGGASIVIDTRAGTVMQGTTNRYNNMGPAPKFFQIPAGLSTVTVAAPNATSSSRVLLSYRKRRRVIV